MKKLKFILFKILIIIYRKNFTIKENTKFFYEKNGNKFFSTLGKFAVAPLNTYSSVGFFSIIFSFLLNSLI